MKLTVYHDGQYWVGVVEELDHGKLRAARTIFGSEPHDEEIFQFIRNELQRLISELTQDVPVKLPEAKRISPKRQARMAADEVKSRGVSSYAQEALKLEYEKRKKEKRVDSKLQREAIRVRKRELKVQKAKEKHRGH